VEVKKHGKNLSLEFTQEWGKKKRLKFEGFSMSDGTLRAIGLLAAVFQRPVPSLIAVEEPEATIHPAHWSPFSICFAMRQNIRKSSLPRTVRNCSMRSGSPIGSCALLTG